MHQADGAIDPISFFETVYHGERALPNGFNGDCHVIALVRHERGEMVAAAVADRDGPFWILKPILPLKTEVPYEIFIRVVSELEGVSEKHDSSRIRMAKPNIDRFCEGGQWVSEVRHFSKFHCR